MSLAYVELSLVSSGGSRCHSPVNYKAVKIFERLDMCSSNPCG